MASATRSCIPQLSWLRRDRAQSDLAELDPDPNMVRAMPHYRTYAGGMSGGIENPLGARTLYLYRDREDTYDLRPIALQATTSRADRSQ